MRRSSSPGHVETAGQPAVRVEYRETVRVAVLRITQSPPVAQADHLVGLAGALFEHGSP
jgi:hypothetical protein